MKAKAVLFQGSKGTKLCVEYCQADVGMFYCIVCSVIRFLIVFVGKFFKLTSVNINKKSNKKLLKQKICKILCWVING